MGKKGKTAGHVYEIKSRHSVEDIFGAIRNGQAKFNGCGLKSNRIRNYFFHGTACVNPNCKLVGTEFRVERHISSNWTSNKSGWHLNLYAKTPKGSWVMMTADHIVPKAKGGSNRLENMQPLCAPCNRRKSDRVVEPHEISVLPGNAVIKSAYMLDKRDIHWGKFFSLKWWLRTIKFCIKERRMIRLPRKWPDKKSRKKVGKIIHI